MNPGARIEHPVTLAVRRETKERWIARQLVFFVSLDATRRYCDQIYEYRREKYNSEIIALCDTVVCKFCANLR